MREIELAGEFYRSLAPHEQREMEETLAEDIYFLEEALQQRVLELLRDADPQLAKSIGERNRFTF